MSCGCSTVLNCPRPPHAPCLIGIVGLQAAEFPAGSFERLIHVACFAVSGYAATAKRTSKPFNPLLGETYEFVCPEKGFRFISEKVSDCRGVWQVSAGRCLCHR